MSTFGVTAIVVTVALALTVVSPVDVAVTVVLSVVAFAASAGMATLTQMSALAPPATATDARGEVQVESRMVAVNAPEAADSVYVSGWKLSLLTCSGKVTEVPTWPPSVWLDGETETANGGASGVTCGLPVAPTFWADVTVSPSFTIVVICLRSLESIVTVKWTATLLPAGTVNPVQLTCGWP